MRKVLYICVGDGPVRRGRVIFLEEFSRARAARARRWYARTRLDFKFQNSGRVVVGWACTLLTPGTHSCWHRLNYRRLGRTLSSRTVIRRASRTLFSRTTTLLVRPLPPAAP